MRIAIVSVQVPFITGGAEILTRMLREELIKRGHEAELVTIPFKWYPQKTLVNCMMAGRMLDLTEVNGEKIDLVIAVKFPAYYIRHENKVIWLMHQHRQAYELWETKFGDIHQWDNGLGTRELITNCDNRYIAEARGIFTIAKNTSRRLMENNGIESVALYHPPLNHEKMYCEEYGDFIFYPSRIDSIKRQRLLIEAARYLKTEVKIVIAGGGSAREIQFLKDEIRKHKLSDRVKLAGFITEAEKLKYYAECLAVYFGAFDEDYGYITLEGFFSKKAVIVHKDAGGPLEFVEDDVNGYVLDCDGKQIAEKLDELYRNRVKAKEMGENGNQLLSEKNISWDYAIDKLLASGTGDN